MGHGDDAGLRDPARARARSRSSCWSCATTTPSSSAAARWPPSWPPPACGSSSTSAPRPRFGRRATDWELKGVPVRLELGPRDLAEDVVTLVRRDRRRRRSRSPLDGIAGTVAGALDEAQAALLAEATARRDARTADVTTIDEAAEAAATGFARIPWATLGAEGEAELAQDSVTVRCLLPPDGSLPPERRRRRRRSPSSPAPTDRPAVAACATTVPRGSGVGADRPAVDRPGVGLYSRGSQSFAVRRRRGLRPTPFVSDWPRFAPTGPPSPTHPTDERPRGGPAMSVPRACPSRRRAPRRRRRTSSCSTSSRPARSLRVTVDQAGGVDIEGHRRRHPGDLPGPRRARPDRRPVHARGVEPRPRAPAAHARPTSPGRSASRSSVKTVPEPPRRAAALRGHARRRRPTTPSPCAARRAGAASHVTLAYRRHREGPHRLRVGPGAQAGRARSRSTKAHVHRQADARRRSSRDEPPRPDGGAAGARRRQGHLGRHAVRRPRRRPRVGLQAAARTPRSTPGSSSTPTPARSG